MKTNETILTNNKASLKSALNHEEIGDDHMLTSMDTPMTSTAFLISSIQKVPSS